MDQALITARAIALDAAGCRQMPVRAGKIGTHPKEFCPRRDFRMATDKQVKFALFLLEKRGYSVKFMDASFKALGAKMRERNGTVEDWLRGMSVGECSRLIDNLK